MTFLRLQDHIVDIDSVTGVRIERPRANDDFYHLVVSFKQGVGPRLEYKSTVLLEEDTTELLKALNDKREEDRRRQKCQDGLLTTIRVLKSITVLCTFVLAILLILSVNHTPAGIDEPLWIIDWSGGSHIDKGEWIERDDCGHYFVKTTPLGQTEEDIDDQVEMTVFRRGEFRMSSESRFG
jgi:hypothetical protein